MIRTSPNNNEADEQAPPRGNSTTQKEAAGSNKPSKLASSSSTPRASTSAAAVAPWTRLSKDPRIVRVSRAFGGKDRHSKVCTVRGLRDRRVRLSVLTAIQLYDLQDRLGLNQPSKAVDWLLDAAKDDIDQLPPLPMIPSIPGSYEVMSHHTTLDQNLWRSRNNDIEEDQEKRKDGEEESDEDEDHGKQVGNSNVIHHGSSSSSNHHLFFSGLLNNTNAMPGYVFNNWDQSQSSNFPLHDQLGGDGFTPHNFNVVSSLPSALSLLTGATQSYFPPHATADAADHRVDVSRHFEKHMGSSHENFLANSVYPSGNSMQRRETPQNLMGMITKIVHSNSEPNKDHEPRSS